MTFEGYASVSSVHGVGYLTSEKSWLGRIFWLACVLAGIFTASKLSYLNIVGWTQNPTVISTVEIIELEVTKHILNKECTRKFLLQSKAEFPSVTICPKKTMEKTFYLSVLDKIDLASEAPMTLVEIRRNLARLVISDTKTKFLSTPYTIRKEIVNTFMMKAGQTCNEVRLLPTHC